MAAATPTCRQPVPHHRIPLLAKLVTSHGDLVTEEIADAEVEERGVSALSAGAASE
jgi:hypothetical protein